jgi:hypothetical protein
MLQIQHQMTLFLASVWQTLFIASLINTFGPTTTIKTTTTPHMDRKHIEELRDMIYMFHSSHPLLIYACGLFNKWWAL